MFVYLFARFLFNPKLLLTDLRSEYGGYLSIVAAVSAVFTLTLSNCLVYNTCQTLMQLLLRSSFVFIMLMFLALIYLPFIHLISEKDMHGSRISDMLVYSGFILAPFYLTLPAALIIVSLKGKIFIYTVVKYIVFLKILIDVISGIKENYQQKTVQATITFFTPILYMVVIPILILLFIIAFNMYA